MQINDEIGPSRKETRSILKRNDKVRENRRRKKKIKPTAESKRSYNADNQRSGAKSKKAEVILRGNGKNRKVGKTMKESRGCSNEKGGNEGERRLEYRTKGRRRLATVTGNLTNTKRTTKQ